MIAKLIKNMVSNYLKKWHQTQLYKNTNLLKNSYEFKFREFKTIQKTRLEDSKKLFEESYKIKSNQFINNLKGVDSFIKTQIETMPGWVLLTFTLTSFSLFEFISANKKLKSQFEKINQELGKNHEEIVILRQFSFHMTHFNHFYKA